MKVIAYWLQPAKPARDFFARVIRDLANQFDAPIFHPHLTLSIAPENSRPPAEVISALERIELTLPIVGVYSSELFTKTLFVKFNQTKQLQEIRDTIDQLAGADERYILDPHLSLLYKEQLPDQTKQKLARSIQLPFREVTFVSLRAVRCESPTQTVNDVHAWELIA